MIVLKEKLCIDPDVLASDIEEEAVLLQLRTKLYYTLNTTGFRIWQSLKNGSTIGETIAMIQEEYNISPEKAQESVENITEQFIEEKLMTIAP